METTWYILGAGAMGSLLALRMQDCGFRPQLLYRNRQRLLEYGHRLQLLEDGERRQVHIEQGLVSDSGNIAQLIICTKANQAAAAVEQVRSRLLPQARVILMHNGMGTMEQVTFLKDRQLYWGVTTDAAYWNSEGLLVVTGRGETRLGQPGMDSAPQWAKALCAELPGLSWDGDIEQAQWRKLLVNCAINPLTAIHRCRNGQLPELHPRQLEAVCGELEAVAAALGYSQLASNLEATVLSVCAATAANHSSMLQDIRNKRASEIEFITGYLCAKAAQLGVACPHNNELLNTIRKLEDGGD